MSLSTDHYVQWYSALNRKFISICCTAALYRAALSYTTMLFCFHYYLSASGHLLPSWVPPQSNSETMSRGLCTSIPSSYEILWSKQRINPWCLLLTNCRRFSPNAQKNPQWWLLYGPWAMAVTMQGYFWRILQLYSGHECPCICECPKSAKDNPPH